MRIGDLDVTVLCDGESTVPGDLYGVHEGHHDEIDEHGVMHLPIAAFLVRTGGKNVLIDAGLGPVRYEFQTEQGQDVALWGGKLPEELARHGVRPEDIDYILPTHLHADHAGWVIQETRSYFPNAILRFGAGDWEENVVNSLDKNFGEGVKEANAAGRVQLIEQDGEVLPGISAMHTPGHTAGHTSFVLSSGTQRAIILGDIISCPLQILATEMEVIFDTDPKLAIRTRERIMREIDGDMLVGGPHFPALRFGRLLEAEGKRYWS
jgi:glyoxylase-like metal-dependent hydrolase (beta-lactamase superfamily II)